MKNTIHTLVTTSGTVRRQITKAFKRDGVRMYKLIDPDNLKKKPEALADPFDRVFKVIPAQRVKGKVLILKKHRK